jgi:hypothetical protein
MDLGYLVLVLVGEEEEGEKEQLLGTGHRVEDHSLTGYSVSNNISGVDVVIVICLGYKHVTTYVYVLRVDVLLLCAKLHPVRAKVTRPLKTSQPLLFSSTHLVTVIILHLQRDPVHQKSIVS